MVAEILKMVITGKVIDRRGAVVAKTKGNKAKRLNQVHKEVC
jgi:hypothetical protein